MHSSLSMREQVPPEGSFRSSKLAYDRRRRVFFAPLRAISTAVMSITSTTV